MGIKMDKIKLLKNLFSQNDSELKEREDTLEALVDVAYSKAVKEAQKEFKKLAEVSPDQKVNSDEVQKLIDKTIKAFKTEFETLVEHFQKELSNQYDKAIGEAAILLATEGK